MWLFTTSGFYSLKHDAASGLTHIRSRSRCDLENLLQIDPQLPAIQQSYPGSDYPWRLLVPASQVPPLLATLATKITYPNFKSAIAQHPDQANKLPAYHKIWHVMEKESRE